MQFNKLRTAAVCLTVPNELCPTLHMRRRFVAPIEDCWKSAHCHQPTVNSPLPSVHCHQPTAISPLSTAHCHQPTATTTFLTSFPLRSPPTAQFIPPPAARTQHYSNAAAICQFLYL